MPENSDGPKFEPTLSNNATLDDLNTAHDTSPATEETLYPIHQVRADNAGSYQKELTQVKTRDQLGDFHTHLEPDPSQDGKKEFEVRTGDDTSTRESIDKRMNIKEENFKKKEARAKSFKDDIATLTTLIDVNRWANFVTGAHSRGELTDQHVTEIHAVIDQKRAELQEARAKSFKDDIATLTTLREVDTWANFVTDAHSRGELTDQHVTEIQAVTDQKRAVLQEVQAKSFKDEIARLIRPGDIDMWAKFVTNAHSRGELTDQHVISINTTINNRRLEIQDGI